MSAVGRIADLSQTSRHVRKVHKRRHLLSRLRVRSLTGPEVFAKFKHLSREAAARPSETIYVTIGEILGAFRPTECVTGHANPKNHYALVS
jgi:hypothetical protein